MRIPHLWLAGAGVGLLFALVALSSFGSAQGAEGIPGDAVAAMQDLVHAPLQEGQALAGCEASAGSPVASEADAGVDVCTAVPLATDASGSVPSTSISETVGCVQCYLPGAPGKPRG